jgi:hypothetical protein
MIDILISCLFASLYCVGIWIASDEGMILYRPKEWLKERLPKFIYKPLIGCVICTASIHGGTAYYLLHGFEYIYFAIPVIAALNYIIIQKYA